MSPETPYAYLRWVCSECDGEPIETRAEDHDLVCETCGHQFAIRGDHRATYVPDEDDLAIDSGGSSAPSGVTPNE